MRQPVQMPFCASTTAVPPRRSKICSYLHAQPVVDLLRQLLALGLGAVQPLTELRCFRAGNLDLRRHFDLELGERRFFFGEVGGEPLERLQHRHHLFFDLLLGFLAEIDFALQRHQLAVRLRTRLMRIRLSRMRPPSTSRRCVHLRAPLLQHLAFGRHLRHGITPLLHLRLECIGTGAELTNPVEPFLQLPVEILQCRQTINFRFELLFLGSHSIP